MARKRPSYAWFQIVCSFQGLSWGEGCHSVHMGKELHSVPHPHPSYYAVLLGSVRIICEVSGGLNLGAFEEMPCGYLGKPRGGVWGRVGKGGERELYWSPFCSGSGPPRGTKETTSAHSNRLCDQKGSAN